MNRRKVIMPNRITQDELSKAAETLGVIDQDGFTYAKEDVVGRGGWELFWKRFGPFRVYVLQQPEA
jgi:hypothetical protein